MVTTRATSNNPAQPPSRTNPIPRSAYSTIACYQSASRRRNAGGIGILIPDENASHSSRIRTPIKESLIGENNLPLSAASHQLSTSERSLSSTEPGSNGIAEETGNLLPDQNASHSSRIGTPTQESSMAENRLKTACKLQLSAISPLPEDPSTQQNQVPMALLEEQGASYLMKMRRIHHE